MPTIRERKSSDQIKEKSGGKGRSVPKDPRRQMTAKLKKELAGRQRDRHPDSAHQTPDVQAAEQVDEAVSTTAHSLYEHTGGAVSKSIRRHGRKRQREKQRPRGPAQAGPPSAGTETPPPQGQAPPGGGAERRPLPSPQERMRRKAKAEAQAQYTGPLPTPSRLERPTVPPYNGGDRPVSFGSQSINPIKERPRRSFVPKERPTGGAFLPKTRQAAAASRARTTALAVKRGAAPAARGSAALRPLEQAKRRVQRGAQRRLLRQSAQRTKTALDLSRKAAAVAVKAVSSLVSALAGLLGSAFLIPVICIVILIAALLASPFGILFSNEPTPDAMPLNVAVGQLNMELSHRLETLQTGDYDRIDIQGQGPDWREVAAVFAARTAGADDGMDVAALTPDRVERLRTVFWDMCAISASEETIDHPASGSTGAWTERILHITITAKTADDMRTEYAFTPYQSEALTELLAELAAMELLLTDLSVSQAQARALLQSLPADLPPERRAVVETTCSLVGKVNYFWGGKSLVIGWDSRWGTIREVWADGSSTTGTYRPYGLDCSGYVDWVFYNITGGEYIIGHGGGAHAQHTYCAPISWDEAQPGDLVFYPDDEHVGIVGGWDESGNIQIIHCASGQNNVVITGKAGFTTIGRPIFYGE